ncbi:hypothetical protein DTO027B5_5366 [Paecilomyces variotii]|nr:hypothetical protein DTO027B3_7063 [Paecilomyces variotii]KAJ9332939.1 hypothetical protein DTO027B5_5366 [Paecilomyces variotii]
MDDKLDSSDTPQLILELDGASTIWTESRNENYSIRVSLRMILSDEFSGQNDNTKDLNQPFWLRWSPEIDPGREDFILLRHDLESNSLQRIGVEEKPRYEVDSIIQQFPNEPPSCYTAEAKKSHDRCRITYRLSFPDTWEELLQLGYTYDLLWTGKDITHWDWITQPEIKDEPKWPPILVPGGAHITTFTVKEGKRPPIPRPPTPPLIQASERVPGAPVLSLELSCSPIMTLTGSLDVHIKVIYHGVSKNNNTAISKEAQPITFHIHAFDLVYGEFRVYRRRCLDQSRPETEEEWETFEGDDFCQFGIWDSPDKLINVSENPKGRFPTLFPGESWSDFWTMTADGYGLPDDLKPGERLRYQFKGNTLDWWDWGTAVAHTQTFVTLPGSEVEPISDPKDNGGRPKVVIPASNVVEWTVVDE